MILSKDQFGGIVRALGTAAIGYLVGKGYDTGLVTELVGAAGVAIIAVWSAWTNRPAVVK